MEAVKQHMYHARSDRKGIINIVCISESDVQLFSDRIAANLPAFGGILPLF